MHIKRSRLRLFALFVLIVMLMSTASAVANDRVLNVYYNQNGKMYKVSTGAERKPIVFSKMNTDMSTVAYRGVDLLIAQSKNTLFSYQYLGETQNKQAVFSKDVVNFRIDGNYVYYVKDMPNLDTHRIYRTNLNNPRLYDKSNSIEELVYESEEEVANMIASNYIDFSIFSDQIYYTARRNGNQLWTASKALDGKSPTRWIAKGAFRGDYVVPGYLTNQNVYIWININPSVTKFSSKCMVLYRVPLKAGKATAINMKTPLDLNAWLTGFWVGGYYYYNPGVIWVAEGKQDGYFDYKDAVGQMIDLPGHTIKVNANGIFRMVQMDENRYIFTDKDGGVYTCSITDGMIKSINKFKIPESYGLQNIYSGGKRVSTLIMGKNGNTNYLIRSDVSSLQKLNIGIKNWWHPEIFGNYDGLIYTNSDDESKLYWLSSDGQINRVLTSVAVENIYFIEPAPTE